jgi:hypothetical protein
MSLEDRSSHLLFELCINACGIIPKGSKRLAGGRAAQLRITGKDMRIDPVGDRSTRGCDRLVLRHSLIFG